MALHKETHLVERIGWLRAAVLGANDGIVSTASLVVGVAAASNATSGALVAGVAGLVAGAMSMAAGEYVSVSSQSDTETADLARESEELRIQPDAELEELTQIYVHRGVDDDLAKRVARQLMAKDALGAHARDELGILEHMIARPISGGVDLGGHVRRWCVIANPGIARHAKGYHGGVRFAGFTSRACRTRCRWGKDRGCEHYQGDSPRHFLGRTCNGDDGCYRINSRARCLMPVSVIAIFRIDS